jgi:hypothetical protein
MLCCPVRVEVSETGWSLVQRSPTVCLYVWLRNPEKGGQRSVLDYKRLWGWGGEVSWYYGIVTFVVKLRAELCVKNMQTQCQCFIIYVWTNSPVRRNLIILFCPPCLAVVIEKRSSHFTAGRLWSWNLTFEMKSEEKDSIYSSVTDSLLTEFLKRSVVTLTITVTTNLWMIWFSCKWSSEKDIGNTQVTWIKSYCWRGTESYQFVDKYICNRLKNGALVSGCHSCLKISWAAYL